MTDWEACNVLVDEDYWDPEPTARRRKLSGVAQGLADLRVMARHYKLDPDDAEQEWDAYARQADDDSISSFNNFCRKWEYLATVSRTPGIVIGRLTYGAPTLGRSSAAASAVGYAHQVLNDKMTGIEVRSKWIEYAQVNNLDFDALWRDFNAFWHASPYNMEVCYHQYKAQLDSDRYAAKFNNWVFDFAKDLAKDFTSSFKSFERLLAIGDELTVAAQPDTRKLRACYRCAQVHGSRPCARMMKRRK